jgi:hypothetical protein
MVGGEWRMRVRVGAARRVGEQVAIFDQPLGNGEISSAPDGNVEIAFLAAGIYDPKSRYRYTIGLSRDELAALVRSSESD